MISNMNSYKVNVFLLGFLVSVVVASAQDAGSPRFRDMHLPVDERTADLVSRMTLAEKVSQLFNHAAPIDRLGIAGYDWWNEGLHGVARAGKATVFPQAIGLAAAFDEPLMYKVAVTISDEGRAKHHYFIHHQVHSIYTGLTFWSPNINIFRDPRWGRGQETYGEDPYLTGRMAVNFIRGLQGDDPVYLKTVATAKHYAVHSGPEFSRHQDDVFINDRDLYETYLPAFKAAVEEAHVQSVMCAYNRLRDQPCCGSNLLLNTILRNQFKFTGYVVSDCGAISDFFTKNAHHVVETPEHAWGWSLSAGTDLNCEESRGFITGNLDSCVKMGIINERDVNTSLKRLFRARMMLGEFDPEDSVSYNKIPFESVGNAAHRALSLHTAEGSLVLLKNNGVLPLTKVGKVALIGPNADNMQVLLGNYNGQPIDPVTPLAALRRALGAGNVIYVPGCPIAAGVFTNYLPVGQGELFHFEHGKLIAGLTGEYFMDTSFTGKPMVRTDSVVHFAWATSPLNGKVEDEFSVRWTGVLVPVRSGVYIFGGNTTVRIDGKAVGPAPVRLEAGRSYSLEAKLVVAAFWWGNTVEPTADLSWVNISVNYEQDALNAADKSDVVVFCGGISPQLEGEEMPLEIDGFAHGDRTHLNLPAVQEELLKKLRKKGKKIVYVNFSGSAIALNWESEQLDAIVQAFYPGEAGGTALVNILLGKVNPSGHLPVTFYRSVNDLPAFKDYRMAGRTYRYFKGNPLYPFGYGLSYTSFSYDQLQLPDTLSCGAPFTVTVNVTNKGKTSGSEVVQVYLSHADTLFEAPVRALAGFKKIFLRAGETQTVSIDIKASQLSLVDDSFERKIFPGKIDVFAGGGQPGSYEGGARGIQRGLVLTGGVVSVP